VSLLDKIKTIWIVTAALTIFGVVGMVTGNVEIAYISVGALAGWVGGNKNGNRTD
jgi:chromate transport protein ChrA